MLATGQGEREREHIEVFIVSKAECRGGGRALPLREK